MKRRRGLAAAVVLAAWAVAGASIAAAREPARASRRVSLVLVLQARTAGLERLAHAISTPGSSQYAHYRSLDWLAQHFGATATARRRVLRYLQSAGATDVRIDATGLFADATMSAARATRLFEAPLTAGRSARNSPLTAPTRAVKLPKPLSGLVTGVVGLDSQPLPTPGPPRSRSGLGAHARAAAQPSSQWPLSGSPSGCGGALGTGGFTPNQYLSAYGYEGMYAAGIRGQGERVALIEVDGFKRGDIIRFARCYGLHVPPLHALAVGGATRVPPGGESTLDLEVLDAAAPDLKAIDIYETAPTPAAVLRALTAPLQRRSARPQIISASLGLCEPAMYLAVGRTGILASEAALAMAAANGITVLASTGDQGSADCTARDGMPIHVLEVNYPASSWWVTGVGGTNLLLTPSNQIRSQLVWNDTALQPGLAGGGGSSRLFRRPFYQRGTVRPDARFTPDVAMLADVAPGYAVYCSARGICTNGAAHSGWISVGGTSAATPLLAGALALVDQELRLHQRQDLGFVNPLLYEFGRSPSLRAQAFSDVLSYGNDVGPYIPGNGQPLGCCLAGPGYDRASGWGSVKVAGFALAALSMQPPKMRLLLPRHQSPVKHGDILANVYCASACGLGAYAEVSIGSSRPFEVDSKPYRLAGKGRDTIPIRFSARQLRRLRAALARHRRVTAMVYAVALDAKNRYQSQTPGKRLVITG